MTFPDTPKEIADGPPRPENVRIVYGTEVVPVDLIYAGVDANTGQHVWRTVVPYVAYMDLLIEGVAYIGCDILPPQTTLQLVLAPSA